MLPQWTIEKKRDGKELDTAEIRSFIDGYTKGLIPDYQMSALAMAVYFKGMTARETADLTLSMMESGKILDASKIPGIKVDKHSTGGIGDKISIPLAPLIATCGGTVPMISGRGLGITGGTLDKLESIPGYRVDFSETEFLDTLKTCRCSIIGQTAEIAPADRKLYALRDVTATVPSIPLIVSSILSKKLAEGIDALVLDVKCGSGAFMKTLEDARRLARALVDTASALGRKVVALITDMNQPIGRNVGNALEIREALDILNGKGPDDARSLTLALAKKMLLIGEIRDSGGKIADPALHLQNGTALDRFRQLVSAHGGDLDARLPTAGKQFALVAPKRGYVSKADAESIGRACLLLGAGRTRTDDTIDHAVGLSDIRKIGEHIEEGAPLCIVHSNGHEGKTDLLHLLDGAFDISESAVEPPPLVLDQIGGG